MSDGHLLMLTMVGWVFAWFGTAFCAAFVGCMLAVLLSPGKAE